MMGYWNDTETIAKVLKDGIIITADLGSIDMKGRLRLHGRSDDVIDVGGYKIAPTEVEDIALAFSGVKDCICIEAPHPVVGKVLKLLIVPDVDYNRKNLVNYLKSKLESHKVPVLYGEIAEVRRTFNGKSIARVIDKKLDFEKDGGIDTPVILFRLNSTIYTLSAFIFLANGYYSIMSFFLTICCFCQEFT